MTRRTPEEYVWDKLQFDETVLTEIPGYPRRTSSRDPYKNISFVAVHHMAMVGQGDGKANDACLRAWRTRKASAHYGVDGLYVRQFVWDSDAAWAVASLVGNKKSVSIEHANSSRGPGWLVSYRTWQRGARLTGYLHWVYDMGRPVKDVTIRRHRDVCGGCTACPGPYLGSMIWALYSKRAQKVYDRLASA